MKGRICGLKICTFISGMVLMLILVGSIVGYFLISDEIRVGLGEYINLCSEDNRNFKDWKSPRKPNFLKIWSYTIQNPLDFLTNGSALVLHEIGPFTFDHTPKKDIIRFSDGGGLLSYTDYSIFKFRSDESCSQCQSANTPKIGFSISYIALIHSGVSHEINLMLLAACSMSQTSYMILDDTTKPICLHSQQGSSFPCRCCDPTNMNGNATCASTTSPSGKVGSLVSWITKHDGGVKISSEVSAAFSLNDGVYSPLITKSTTGQTLFGHTHALLGFFKSVANIGTYTSPSSTPSEKESALLKLQDAANVTSDVGSVCMPLYCPTLSSLIEITAETPTSNIAVMREASCAGFIPGPDELRSRLGFSQEKADRLRYLEGVDCSPYTVTLLATAVTILRTQAEPVCINKDESVPCCSMSTALGPGIGCLTWVSGLAVDKRVFSAQESNSNVSIHTNCAAEQNRLNHHTVDGIGFFDRWFTPSDPSVSWTLGSAYQKALKGSLLGTMHRQQVTGVDGRTVVSSGLNDFKFLSRQLSTSDSPPSDTVSLWNGRRNLPIELKKESTREEEGVTFNRFVIDLSPRDDAELRGELPYPNMQNLLYTRNLPVIASAPHFMGVNYNIYNQTDNSAHSHPSKRALYMYTDSDGSEPEEITPEYIARHKTTEFATYLDIEPASGIVVGGQGTEMLSTFIPDCDPAADPSCRLGVKVGSATRCYMRTVNIPNVGSVPADYPCSAFNVFSPLVMGGKVFPVGWVKQGSREDGVKAFGEITLRKLVLDILVIAVPGLMLVLLTAIIAWDVAISRKDAPVDVFSDPQKDLEQVNENPVGGRSTAYAATGDEKVEE